MTVRRKPLSARPRILDANCAVSTWRDMGDRTRAVNVAWKPTTAAYPSCSASKRDLPLGLEERRTAAYPFAASTRNATERNREALPRLVEVVSVEQFIEFTVGDFAPVAVHELTILVKHSLHARKAPQNELGQVDPTQPLPEKILADVLVVRVLPVLALEVS